jgi:NADH dehydrogenase [ubiquinone] 1 alpha subcomplex assembly factor 2
MVQYKDHKEIGDHIVEDQRNIPIQWMLWLRQTRRDPPSLEELRLDSERIESTRHNARVLAFRDAQQKEKALLERQAEHEKALHLIEQSRSGKASAGSGEALEGRESMRLRPDAGLASGIAEASSSTRRPAAPVPTSVVSDAEAEATRDDRVTSEGDVLRQRSGEGAATSFTRQEREPDNDVWAASRARLRAQEAQEGRASPSRADPPQATAPSQQSASLNYTNILAQKQERRQARDQEEATANAELDRARKMMRNKSVLSDFDVEIDDGRQGATVQPRARR